eukprot:1192759-Prorocentrum_minimum.AAC.2
MKKKQNCNKKNALGGRSAEEFPEESRLLFGGRGGAGGAGLSPLLEGDSVNLPVTPSDGK